VTERVMSPGPPERIAPINVSPKILDAGKITGTLYSVYYVDCVKT